MGKRHLLAEKSLRRVGVATAVLAAVLLCSERPVRGQLLAEFTIPTAQSAPGGIAPGPDGNLWFTETHGNKIGRITTGGSITEFPTPTSDSNPSRIVAGPDGALWFTEESGNKIGRITTSGVLTEFPVPSAGSGPRGIATGPDGALWFTERTANKIGRITTAGSITEFVLPTADSSPDGIAAGLDGALWFTEGNANKIGRIATVGAINEFPIPTGNSVPAGIARGPDGAMWFSEQNANKIGRIVIGFRIPDGTIFAVINEFALPTANSSPSGIAAASDGQIWFTESLGNKLGQFVGIGGFINEFMVPTAASGLNAIATGPAGTLWFTEQSANQIGRITTSVVPCGSSVFSSSNGLCLSNGRFNVEATATRGGGLSGSAQAVVLTPDSGFFWFFSASNPELVVKLLDGCAINGHSWFFAAGLTDISVVLTVTDTQTGVVRFYTNPQGTAFQPVQDANAFPCLAAPNNPRKTESRRSEE